MSTGTVFKDKNMWCCGSRFSGSTVVLSMCLSMMVVAEGSGIGVIEVLAASMDGQDMVNLKLDTIQPQVKFPLFT
jgi:hypothetical protein